MKSYTKNTQNKKSKSVKADMRANVSKSINC